MGIKIEFLEHQEKQEKASPSEVRAFRREDFRAVAFEARLQDLSKQLPNLNGELEVTTREGSPAACDPAADLRVKVEAVRWMLRVAKHVQDPARERILLTVNSSLDQLERAVNQRPHAA